MFPSANWTTAQENEHDEDCHVSAYWRIAPLDALEGICQNMRPMPCKVNRDKYSWGQNSLVVEVIFDDGQAWIARLRPPQNIDGEDVDYAVIAEAMERDVAVLKLVREKTTIPVPIVHAYSATPDNALGTPYNILSAMPGRRPSQIGIDWYSPTPEMAPLVERYFASLADFMCQLSTIRFDRIGSVAVDPDDASRYVVTRLAENGLGPFDSASQYYAALARKVERAIVSNAAEQERTMDQEGLMLVMWLYRLALGPIATRSDDRGPFILGHNDLHQENVLVDETGAIVGVIDWDNAGPVPVPVFAANALDGLSWHYGPCGKTSPSWHDEFNTYIRTHPALSWLADTHASTATQVVGRVARYLAPWMNARSAEALSSHVLGTTEYQSLKSSPLFQEWYAATVRELSADSLGQGPV